MAQNITIMGASYSDVPAVQLPKTGGGTARFDDASITTATASDVASGKVFLASDGTITTGTSSGGGGTTTPYYMWRDSSGYVHFSATDHSGYQINVSSVEEHYNWTTIYSATISEWTRYEHGVCYDYSADFELIFDPITEPLVDFRITFDGTVYMIAYTVVPFGANVVGSDLHDWDGTSTPEYPFGIIPDGNNTIISVTTNASHSITIERAV